MSRMTDTEVVGTDVERPGLWLISGSDREYLGCLGEKMHQSQALLRGMGIKLATGGRYLGSFIED